MPLGGGGGYAVPPPSGGGYAVAPPSGGYAAPAPAPFRKFDQLICIRILDELQDCSYRHPCTI